MYLMMICDELGSVNWSVALTTHNLFIVLLIMVLSEVNTLVMNETRGAFANLLDGFFCLFESEVIGEIRRLVHPLFRNVPCFRGLLPILFQVPNGKENRNRLT